MWFSTLWYDGVQPIQWGVVIGASLVAASIDARTHRIPNVLTCTVLVCGLGWAAWQSGIAGLADAFSAAVLLAAPYVLLFLFAKGGAGDAKMMAAIGAWLGVMNGLVTLAVVAITGGILAVIFTMAKKQLAIFGQHMRDIVNAWVLWILCAGRGSATPAHGPSPDRDWLRLPYGIAIFVGVCVAAGGNWLWRVG